MVPQLALAGALPTASPTEPSFGTSVPTLDVEDGGTPGAALAFALPRHSRFAAARFALHCCPRPVRRASDLRRAGRRVVTLAEARSRRASTRSSGRDSGEDGGVVAPGVYLARLLTSAGAVTRTIVRLDR